MAWFTKPLEITMDGMPTGKFRMTARSDEDGGGPWGNEECFHDTPDEAYRCERCDEFISQVTGFPTRKQIAEMQENKDRRNYERLKAKYETYEPKVE
jgi:hypothetical protein